MAKMQNCNDQFALSALKLESERQEARIAVLKPVIDREVKLLELAGEKRIRAVAGGDEIGEETQMVVGIKTPSYISLYFKGFFLNFINIGWCRQMANGSSNRKL